MTHEKRLPECQEKFDAVSKELVSIQEKKADKNGGWTKHLPLSVVVVILLSICTYVTKADEKAAEEREALKEKYNNAIIEQMKQNKDIFVKLESINENLKFIKSKLKLDSK